MTPLLAVNNLLAGDPMSDLPPPNAPEAGLVVTPRADDDREPRTRRKGFFFDRIKLLLLITVVFLITVGAWTFHPRLLRR